MTNKEMIRIMSLYGEVKRNPSGKSTYWRITNRRGITISGIRASDMDYATSVLYDAVYRWMDSAVRDHMKGIW